MPTSTATKKPAKKVAAKKTVSRPTALATSGGRPRSYDAERRQIQIRLPEEIRERLDAEADRRRVSKNFLIEQMIASQLPEWEKQNIGI